MNRPMRRGALMLALLLSACARREAIGGNDADLYQANSATLTPGLQSVRIGEGGPDYPACSSTGTVVNLSPTGETYLALHAAPFSEADEVARLGEGTKLFLCSRSLDQRWHGVVVPPADAPDSDCGVTATLAAARPYAGPCRSGWVLSAFIRPAG